MLLLLWVIEERCAITRVSDQIGINYMSFAQIFALIYSMKYIVTKKLSLLKILRQPASADFFVFSTCFKFIQQKVENQKSSKNKLRELKNLLKLVAFFFFFTVQ